MLILVSDTGGTNTRLALFEKGGSKLEHLAKFPNKDFQSLYAVVESYLNQTRAKPDAYCLDVAGPVANGTAQLTNIDWTISETDMAQEMGIPSVKIINDLVAMGLSLTHLDAGGLDVMHAGDVAKFDNEQSLVINLGTGFNICPVKEVPQPIALAVEAGHSATPQDVMTLLAQELDPQTLGQFDTVEKCFAGRRVKGLFAALGGDGEMETKAIVHAALADDPIAVRTLRLFQRMLGLYTASTALNYLPQRGIYFAGSVARGVLAFEKGTHFFDALNQPRKFSDRVAAMPIKVIKEDAAPLWGCVEKALQTI